MTYVPPPPPIEMPKISLRMILILIFSGIITHYFTVILSTYCPYVYDYIAGVPMLNMDEKTVNSCLFVGFAIFFYSLTPHGVTLYLKSLYLQWRSTSDTKEKT